MSIKSIQTDWGGEFRTFTSYLKDNGIGHRVTCPHTSEQNGIIERKHRHIVELGLTLIAHSSMPLVYWDDAFNTATYLINRLPTPVLDGQSPYEKLFGTKPDYKMHKIFGCLCFPHLRPFNNTKLQLRSTPCVFLGYSNQHKGYKCLDISSKRMYVSRHVLFYEFNFPFASSTKLSDVDLSKSSTVTLPLINNSLPISNSANSSITLPSSSNSNTSTTPSEAPLPISSEFETVSSPQFSSSLASASHSHNNPTTSTTSVVANPRDSSNTHPMTTRAKAGIFKPRVLLTEYLDNEPPNFKLALKCPHWIKAMKEEYDALLNNATWDLVPCPKDKKIIGCKWIYKVKRNSNGSLARYKARLVAKGFHQTADIDYNETFSPVIKPTTIRILLTLVLTYNWKMHQLDINNAFLHG